MAWIPDQPLLALQPVASVLDQVSSLDCPEVTPVGLAEMLTVGADVPPSMGVGLEQASAAPANDSKSMRCRDLPRAREPRGDGGGSPSTCPPFKVNADRVLL